ncbi:MAG: hypothetical protein M1837_000642 [Sclerophora amabilis]|nr:MAG: hypothetical protein M1837_000642 [Sclerophora amabilis]
MAETHIEDSERKSDDAQIETAVATSEEQSVGKNGTEAVIATTPEAKLGADASEKKNGARIEPPEVESGISTAKVSSHEDKTERRHQGKGPASHPRKNNSKFDPSSLEITDDPDQIRKQASISTLVEFYFSDSNLPMDKFLYDQVGGSKNSPVKISLLHDFKRMKRFQPYEAIVAALKDSQVLDVTEDELVRRKVPLDEPTYGKTVEEGKRKWEDKTMSRSIYAKGFGEEGPKTQFDIEAFFAPYGPTNAIRLRRTPTRNFKGSAFVEFADDETQQAFMALDPKPKWRGNELLIKTKQDYVDTKAADIAAGRIKPTGSYKYSREQKDPDDWKKRREEDQKRGFKNDRVPQVKATTSDSAPRQDALGSTNTIREDDAERNRQSHIKTELDTSSTSAPVPEVPVKTEANSSDLPSQGTKRVREDDIDGQESSRKKVDVKTEET